MQLPSNFSSVVDFSSQLPQQKIAKVISVFLLAYIAYVFHKSLGLLRQVVNIMHLQMLA